MVGRYRAGIHLVLLGWWAVLVWLAPAERTLGGGIRSVYVHVGLVWAGPAYGGVAALPGARADRAGDRLPGTPARVRPPRSPPARPLLLAWDVGGARLVMHSHDPIRTATSSAIQWTFATSFALAAALDAWTVIALRAHPRPR